MNTMRGCVVALLLALSLLADRSAARTPGSFAGPSWLQRWRSRTAPQSCRSSSRASGPAEPTPATAIFDQLSIAEYYQGIKHMVKAHGYTFLPGWNFTEDDVLPPSMPAPNINYIYQAELLPLPKAQALEYLSNPGSSAPPPRFARVIVIRGAPEHRDVMEYKVGPLGGDDAAVTSTPITVPGEIPYTMSPWDVYQYFWGTIAAQAATAPLKDLWLNMTGGKYCVGDPGFETGPSVSNGGGGDYEDCDTDHISSDLVVNWLSNDTNGRIGHVIYYWTPGFGGDAYYLHPLPLTHKLNWTAQDPREWWAFSFEYCHQYFDTAEQLLDAFYAGTLTTCSAPEWSDDTVNIDWARIDNVDGLPPRPGSHKPSPRQFSPESQRFGLSGSNRGSGTHFSWMGWEGHVTLHPFTGLQLFDIRFKGERIVYELSLQDQMVQYSGYSHQGQTLFSDSWYNLGVMSMPLKPGLDCPEDAEYVSLVLPDRVGRPEERKQVMCFHETDPGTSNWRHFYFDTQLPVLYPQLYGTRDTHFVIRSIATVGNYDYMYEVHFHLDGTIDVKVVMAGYMEASFNDPAGQTWRSEKLAPRVHKYTRANLHTHLSNWKVDLDIKGTRNSVVKQAVKVGTYKDMGLETPKWAAAEDFPMQYIHTEKFETERAYTLSFHEPVSMQVRGNHTDAWGNQAGYALVHGATSMELLPSSHPLTRTLAWAKYHMAFTQHKDEEWISHDARYAYSNLWRPRFSLDTYLAEAESIEEEDVVAWVSLTAQHIPRTEDVPLIANKAMHFMLVPWNYWPSLQSLDVPTNNDFQPCTPRVGDAYNYTWQAEPIVVDVPGVPGLDPSNGAGRLT